jgi:PAS domain S-box-containing protein
VGQTPEELSLLHIAPLRCSIQPHPLAPASRKQIYFLFSTLVLFVLFQILGAMPAIAASSAYSIGSQTFQTSAEGNDASLIFGFFMGIMLTAAAYLFFIWIVVRERGQVFLLCLLISLSAYIASSNEGIMGRVGIYNESMRDLFGTYSMVLSCIFSTCFTYYFLDVDLYNPPLRVPLFVLGGILGIYLLYVLVDRSFGAFILPVITTLTVATILCVGIMSLRQGVSGSFTHVIAFIFFLGGVLADPLYDLGFINSSANSHNFTFISFAMAALMFAIVIASQFASQQEEKEKALALSNERFAMATRGSNEGLFDWTLFTGEVFFSDQFRKIIGHRLENGAEGLRYWMRHIYGPDRRIVREAMRRFRRSPDVSTINVEYRFGLEDHQRRWLHSKAVAVRDPRTQKVIRLVGSTADVTARKQSEVALRASEARFRSITEAHPVPVMIVGLRNGTILYASPGAERLLLTGQGQLVHEYFDRFLTDPDARNNLWAAMKEGREVNLQEVNLDRGDNRKLETALSARRISYQGEDSMVIGLYDLTERKQAEAQISRQQEALQQSEKMAALGGLLAGVAHELNNPLSVVVGQATLLMEGSSEPKVVTRAEKIFKAADRCARIVKSFLALARRKPPERKPVNINTIVSGALELLGFQLRTGNIEVETDLSPAVPEISGDSDQLTQVITNLILNAAQALEGWSGPRRITLRSRSENGRVDVSVVDTGPGVPQEIRTRIFEPFFTTKGGKGGTGVGLSFCINIVSAHGGQLLVEDAPGGGAVFTLHLPVAEASHDETGPKNTEAKDTPLQKLKFLLVDDEVELAQTLADLLEPEGHQVDIAINGAIALEKLHKASFDLIISDLRMPVLDGPGLYEALGRELPSYLNKIIYVTGDTLSSHVQTFLSQHTVPVIEKPYRLNDVHRAVAALLKATSGANVGKPADSTVASA